MFSPVSYRPALGIVATPKPFFGTTNDAGDLTPTPQEKAIVDATLKALKDGEGAIVSQHGVTRIPPRKKPST
jgi:hypothetical protein